MSPREIMLVGLEIVAYLLGLAAFYTLLWLVIVN
jgi:hypothetical protein